MRNLKSLPETGTGWIVRMRGGALDADDRAGIAQWLEASPERPRELLRAEAAWRLSGLLDADPQVHAELAQLDQLRAAHAAARKRRRTGWTALAAAAGLGAIAILATHHFSPAPTAYQTARGEQRVVILRDGSSVALNTDTRLTVRLSEKAREIELEHGEALFQVAPDPARPFLVRVGSGLTRVLGTRFNVLNQDGGATVSVLEGRVEVTGGQSSSSEKRLLTAGQSAAYTARGTLVTPEPMQASQERISAWREGKLRFESWPLDRAVSEYNRYAEKPIQLEVEPAANIRISGVFRIGDSAAFVRALGELVGAGVVDRGDALVLRSPP